LLVLVVLLIPPQPAAPTFQLPNIMKFFITMILHASLALSAASGASSVSPATTMKTMTEDSTKLKDVEPTTKNEDVVHDYHTVRRRNQNEGTETTAADFKEEEEELNNKVEADFNKKTPAPTPRPTSAPLPSGAYAISTATDCGAYTSIGGNVNATTIVFKEADGTVTTDEGTANLALPQSFNYFGDKPIKNLVLSSNGIIIMAVILGTTGGFSAQPIAVGGIDNLKLLPRISFLHQDLRAISVNTLGTPSSFIISFDSAYFYDDPLKIVQVQIELFYATGDFQIRWGTIVATNNTFACGIDDDTRLLNYVITPFALPCAIRTPNLFDSVGVTIGNQQADMPQNSCLAFKVIDGP
jgi:hypothetical protein